MTTEKNLSKAEIQRRFEAALRGALSTPPKPLKEIRRRKTKDAASDASEGSVRPRAGKLGKSGQ
jgi:hypothetical protein